MLEATCKANPKILERKHEMENIPISSSGDFHFIEKANGIKYLYAWLDKHPDVCAVVASNSTPTANPIAFLNTILYDSVSS